MQNGIQQRQLGREMEKLEAERKVRPAPAPRERIKARTQKILAFSEGKDEMDYYLLRLESMIQHKDGIKARGLQI